MRYSPASLFQKASIRRLVASLPNDMEAVYLIGFDWQMHYWVLGPLSDEESRSTILAKQDDRCYRAIVYARPMGIRTHFCVVVIGGRGFYNLSLNQNTRNVYWCPPNRELYYELDMFVAS